MTRSKSKTVRLGRWLSVVIFIATVSSMSAAESDEPADALSVVNQQPGNDAKKSVKNRQVDNLDDIRRNSAPLLAEMASEHGYRLESDQVLRRITPPFPDVRATYYKVGHPTQADFIHTPADAMTFLWDGEKLKSWGMTFGAGYRIPDVIDHALKIKPPDIEGPDELLNRRLKGDWVIRPGAAEEKMLQEFETILQKQFNMPVRLAFAKRVRTVYVARGKYRFTPVERDEGKPKAKATPRTGNDQIEIYGKQLSNPALGGGGSGDLNEFLAWLGRWIKVSIINEVETPPTERLSWHDNHTEKGASSDDHDPEVVLKNIAAQTGLTFTKDLRVVRRVLIEPIE